MQKSIFPKFFLAATSLLKSTKKEEKKTIEEFFLLQKKRHYEKGDHIFTASDVIEEVVYISKGFVRMYTISEEGEEIILYMYGPSSLLALMEILPNIPNHYSFQAMSDVQVYASPKDSFFTFLQANPSVTYGLLVRFGSGISRLLYRVETMCYESVSRQLAIFLYDMARSYGNTENGHTSIDIHLTHSDIANWMGIKRETVTRHMKILQKQGIVQSHQRRKVRITNLPALKSLLPAHQPIAHIF